MTRSRLRKWMTGVLLLAAVAVPGLSRAQEAPRQPRTREGEFRYKDPRFPETGMLRRWEATVGRIRDEKARDPRYNALYRFSVWVRPLLRDPDTSREYAQDTFAVVNYTRPQDEALARNVAGALARICWVVRDYLGRSPDKDGVDVWLRPEGQAGGGEYRGNIYLSAIDEARAPAEWLREIAHEYSHLSLPRIGPYSAPEEWAGGYLGERLILKWLLYDNGVSEVWDRPVDGRAYVGNQVLPLRDRFLDGGPDAPASASRDAAGMEFLIGEVLAVEAVHGPQAVRGLLEQFRAPQPDALGLHLADALRRLPEGRFQVDPSAFIPSLSQAAGGPKSDSRASGDVRLRKASYWLMLPGGSWSLQLDGAVPEGAAASVAFTEVRPTASPGTWIIRTAGEAAAWRRLDLAAPAGKELSLRRIVLTRAG